LEQELRRRRRDANADAAAVRLLHEVEELAFGKTRVGDDQLVDRTFREDAGHGVERAEDRQSRLLVIGRDRTEELVFDPAAGGTKRREQLSEALALADENRAPPRTGKTEDVAGDDVVARTEHADEQGRQDERGRRQAVRREVVAGPDPE